MDEQRAWSLYHWMLTARRIDAKERELVAQNRAHFHVSGAGHEATAALAFHLTSADWLHLHYRDKALLVARGLEPEEFFRSLLCRPDSHSAGRQMSAHYSAPHLRVLSMVGPVGNNCLQAAGVAAAVKHQAERPLVVCSVGDGTTQQGEFYEAVAEAVRDQLPVLFLIADNRYSISTPTRGRTFFETAAGRATTFFGLPIEHLDGSDPVQVDRALAGVVAGLRETRTPALVVLHVERLCDHTNADDQARYRPASELPDRLSQADPIAQLAGWLGSPQTQRQVERQVEQAVEQAAARVCGQSAPAVVAEAKRPLVAPHTARAEYRGHGGQPRLVMLEAINAVLRDRLENDPRVFLFGQDIEDPKGDVFGVTRGLSSRFAGRVVNAPLSESTILGTCIGRALAGQQPVAFIQFADFLPLAANQILSELGSMYWRTNGGWQAAVIVMVACGGYKPGLGPFHAQTLESLMIHTPGLDVVMPSSAADAAGLLNAAFDSGRPTIFFYPKSCLNLPDRSTSSDTQAQFVPLGKARRLRDGRDLTLATWGSAVKPSLQACDALESAGFGVDLWDLRSLSPWDQEAITESAQRTGRLVVVHEDNLSCGFGAEVVAHVAQRASRPVAYQRVTRPDVYIPCNFSDQLNVLPSMRRVLEACAELLSCEVEWRLPAARAPGELLLGAMGSGPADETVELLEVVAHAGARVRAGQTLAHVEATKSAIEIDAPCDGVVLEVLAEAGQKLQVGQPLFRLKADGGGLAVAEVGPAEAIPTLRRRPAPLGAPQVARAPRALNGSGADLDRIFISRPVCVMGSEMVETAVLAAGIDGWSAQEAEKRTGIARRHWVGRDDTAASMAQRAATQLLDSLRGACPPIAAVICSTTMPQVSTPSVASQVASCLAPRGCLADPWCAFDFNAACSGFLYGAGLALDLLGSAAGGAVLLLTAEVLSPILDRADPVTVFLFGDAASAVLLTRAALPGRSLRIRRPLLAGEADAETTICAPCHGAPGHLRMDGIAVARAAYKTMVATMQRALAAQGLAPRDLAALVPHPGSKRILQNVAEFLEIPPSRVWHTIGTTGNTSSTSIPLALDRYWNELPREGQIGLVAFGAGYTAAAAVGQFVGE